MHFLREPQQLWALLMVALLGARTMDCRCTEPHIPFGALLPALAALLPLSLVYAFISSHLEEAGAAPKGDIAAEALGSHSNRSPCQDPIPIVGPHHP